MIWVLYVTFGFTISSFVSAFVFTLYADSDISACLSANYAIALYLIILIVFTLVAHGRIMYWPSSKHGG